MNLFSVARVAHEANLCVVPPKQDGSKRPISAWRQYQKRQSSIQEIQDWYGSCTGIGLVLGEISLGAEVLEFDDVGVYEQFKEIGKSAGLSSLIEKVESGYLEASPGGIHWLYRCNKISGNTKLARRPKTEAEKIHQNDNVAVLIETRGEGGYVITAPSNGNVHPSGKPYRLLRGGFSSVAVISEDEREALFDLARSFDQMPRRIAGDRQPEQNRDRPGDDFNARRSWKEVLEPHGWSHCFDRGVESHWRRPGKNHGSSATTNYEGSDLLKVFSSSTPFETEKTYTKFGAYAVLNYGGDYVAAARSLSPERPTNSKKNNSKANKASQLRPFIRTTLDVSKKPEARPVIGRYLYKGGLTIIQAEPGIGKSWLALDIALGIMKNGGVVLYFDEEGGQDLVRERLYALRAPSETINDLFWYFPFEARSWTDDDIEALHKVIDEASQIGPVQLGIFDSLPDFLTAAGLNEDKAQDVTTFTNKVCATLRDKGVAQLALDHLVKPEKGKNKSEKSRYSRGSGSKLAKADATILLEAVEEFDATHSGRLRIWKTKDRLGRLDVPKLSEPGQIIDVKVRDGYVTITDGTAQEWHGPTECMKKILEKFPVGAEMSFNRIFDTLNLGFRRETVQEALGRLVLSRQLKVRNGPRHSLLYSRGEAVQPSLSVVSEDEEDEEDYDYEIF